MTAMPHSVPDAAASAGAPPRAAGASQPYSEAPRVSIVTGLSGAGKSTALRVFEDLRHLAVDGLPASLAPEMASMMQRESMRHFKGIALGMDIRQGNFLEELNAALSELSGIGIRPQLVFLEADDKTLMRRYAATRRPHPLEREGMGLEAALHAERERLKPLREMADLVLDTSRFSIHDLRRAIQKQWNREAGVGRTLRVNILSFGFKYGIPHEADMVFDLRFLPNPYFVEDLRRLSGRDKPVADYVFASPQASEYAAKLLDLLLFLLPQMEAEGRYRVTVALGCTGGRHRSVALAEHLAQAVRQAGYPVTLEHRHLELG
ncbi:MAG: RNase adapter RapZ [Desulfovibrio sp.]|nr:RNase adapter RapZ [Desulfovibrio sp.]